jgi:hypothetical protein
VLIGDVLKYKEMRPTRVEMHLRVYCLRALFHHSTRAKRFAERHTKWQMFLDNSEHGIWKHSRGLILPRLSLAS